MEYLESIATRYNVRVCNTEPLEGVVTISVERGIQELAPSEPPPNTKKRDLGEENVKYP